MTVVETMSGRTCFRCGKGSLKGNWVSHANNKNSRRLYVNLRPFKLIVNGATTVVKLCTKCLRIEKEKMKKLKLAAQTEQIIAKAHQTPKPTPTFI